MLPESDKLLLTHLELPYGTKYKERLCYKRWLGKAISLCQILFVEVIQDAQMGRDSIRRKLPKQGSYLIRIVLKKQAFPSDSLANLSNITVAKSICLDIHYTS